MSCNNYFPVLEKDIDECNYEINLCKDVMTCACCSYFLEKYKQSVIAEIKAKLKIVPKKITRIKIPLYPLPDNKYYYSFDGISTIVYNLFKTENLKHKKSVEKYQAFLKVYYENNSLFSVPVIQIEVLFLGELKSMAIDEYWKVLKAEVLFFTGSVGDIDVINIEGIEHLHQFFNMPLLFGYPEFKHDGILKEHRFSEEQVKEMNYMHSVALKELQLKDVINDNCLELFENEKNAMMREKADYYFDKEERDRVISEFFKEEADLGYDDKSDNEINDDIPF